VTCFDAAGRSTTVAALSGRSPDTNVYALLVSADWAWDDVS
jgi:hypothetical protein